ncbi:uncharacterized protein LOC108701150 [Xenopus laevis]|uniref:Uncharacterized protein LOC108701150 n=2 Tax=Xenopus laevis TaxID=8355 RepID=A0A1L8EUM3_XENLA|nr:uncharacterized protein LOC108701150 [Xenopus laevis]OCT63044.1 hypothetical protein XELAEV_18044138mg [Xenopus laevis]
MGVICVFFISFLFSSFSLQTEISQHPMNVKEYTGNSATIQCSVDEETDIRELSLTLRLDGSQLISVKVDKSLSSYTHELTFSGQIQNFSITANGFSWKLLASAYCHSETCQGELSAIYQKTSNDTIFCMANHTNVNKAVICNNSQPIILLTVNNSYTDRLRFSGTIQNFSMTLEDLKKSDTDGYYCKGKKEDSNIQLFGGQTIINVIQRDNSHIVSVTWLLILSSLLLIWWC